jgi:hypothetical protein
MFSKWSSSAIVAVIGPRAYLRSGHRQAHSQAKATQSSWIDRGTGQFVHKGDVVFRLDPSGPRAGLAQSQAALMSAKANLACSQVKRDRMVNGRTSPA